MSYIVISKRFEYPNIIKIFARDLESLSLHTRKNDSYLDY